MHVPIHCIAFLHLNGVAQNNMCDGNMIYCKLSFLSESCGTVRINSEHLSKCLNVTWKLKMLQWKEFMKLSFLAF